jgi:hypothetical protein
MGDWFSYGFRVGSAGARTRASSGSGLLSIGSNKFSLWLRWIARGIFILAAICGMGLILGRVRIFVARLMVLILLQLISFISLFILFITLFITLSITPFIKRQLFITFIHLFFRLSLQLQAFITLA